MALLRVVFIYGVILTVLYFLLSLYSRAACKDRLTREWEDNQGPGDRDSYIAEGLEEYDGSLRKKLLLGVYVVPFVAFAVIIVLIEYL
ncbi:MAG: hypothetical protein AAFQ66_04860 [Pseudomonadota bacterium]